MDNLHGRRVGGKAKYSATAAELLTTGDLEDYAAFVTYGAVAQQSGVEKNAVSSRYAGKKDFVLEVMRHALASSGYVSSRSTAAAVEAAASDLRTGDLAAVYRIAEAAANELLAYSEPEAIRTDTAAWLATAAAPNDENARRLLRELYRDLADLYVPGYELLAANTNRRFTSDISVDAFATGVSALTDGFLARRRFDPDAASVELFAKLVIGMFEFATIEAKAPEDLGIGDRLVAKAKEPLVDRDRLSEVARELYNASDSWDDVTFRTITEAAGVERSAVVAAFGNRGSIAAAVWAQWVGDLESRLTQDAKELDFELALTNHVHRVADHVVAHRELTGAMLAGVWDYTVRVGPPDYLDPHDPRTIAQLPPVALNFLFRNRTRLRSGYINTTEDALVLSAFVHNTTLQTAMTRGRHRGARFTEMTTSDIARYVVSVVLHGCLKPPPAEPVRSTKGGRTARARPRKT